MQIVCKAYKNLLDKYPISRRQSRFSSFKASFNCCYWMFTFSSFLCYSFVSHFLANVQLSSFHRTIPFRFCIYSAVTPITIDYIIWLRQINCTVMSFCRCDSNLFYNFRTSSFNAKFTKLFIINTSLFYVFSVEKLVFISFVIDDKN